MLPYWLGILDWASISLSPNLYDMIFPPSLALTVIVTSPAFISKPESTETLTVCASTATDTNTTIKANINLNLICNCYFIVSINTANIMKPAIIQGVHVKNSSSECEYGLYKLNILCENVFFLS